MARSKPYDDPAAKPGPADIDPMLSTKAAPRHRTERVNRSGKGDRGSVGLAPGPRYRGGKRVSEED